MATTQPTPPFLELAFSVLCGDQVSFNRFFYDGTAYEGTPTQAATDTAVNDWQTAIESAWQNFAAADCTLFRYTGRYRDIASLWETFKPVAAAGGVAGEALPFQDCSVITWEYPKALGATRISRGRSFISGIAEGETTGGLMSLTAHTHLLALADAIKAPAVYGGTQLPLFIWSPTRSDKLTPNGRRADIVIKTLRRRRQLS